MIRTPDGSSAATSANGRPMIRGLRTATSRSSRAGPAGVRTFRLSQTLAKYMQTIGAIKPKGYATLYPRAGSLLPAALIAACRAGVLVNAPQNSPATAAGVTANA